MIFTVKMDFTRKVMFVTGCHTTKALSSFTYFSVVARNSVQIVLILAALHGVDVLAADFGNAQLNARRYTA